MSSTSGFGFTIGAPKAVLECISRVDRFMGTTEHTDINSDVNELLAELLVTLGICSRDEDVPHDSSPELNAMVSDDYSQLLMHETRGKRPQRKAFLCAAYIYIYRNLLDIPPRTIRSYVTETFEHVSTFYNENSGNFSIWPAFIAAVEAYTPEDMATARCWLNRATSFGLGNRASMRHVVEEVWKRREALSIMSGLESGSLTVDWRLVMQEMNFDLLLI